MAPLIFDQFWEKCTLDIMLLQDTFSQKVMLFTPQIHNQNFYSWMSVWGVWAVIIIMISESMDLNSTYDIVLKIQ